MMKKLNILFFAAVLAWFFGVRVSFAAETLFEVDSSTVALWRFNDDATSFVKDETGVNHGTAFGGATVVGGKFGRAREFNGSGQYIEVPNHSSLNNLNQITIESWINLSGFDLGCWANNEALVQKGHSDNYTNAYALRIWRNSDDGCSSAYNFDWFTISGSFGGSNLSASLKLFKNEWHYVVYVYDGKASKIYIDGRLEASSDFIEAFVSNSDPIVFNKDVWWGGGGNSAGRILGLVDETRISNKARSSEEILATYERALEEKRPVIIIPGILGSWGDINRNLELDPILHTYDNLVNIFSSNGYTEGEMLFKFPYDWQKSNVYSADLLKINIDAIKEKCECDKVDIVAHSMGGLVTRQYIQSEAYENDVNKIIFLGTPHRGTPKTYLIWEAGEDAPGKAPTSIEILLSYLAQRGGFKERFDYVRSLPSIQQILSIDDYLTGSTGNKWYSVGYPKNEFLEKLNSNDSIQLINELGIKFSNFIANNNKNNTYERFYVVPTHKAPLWEDGYPEGYDLRKGDHGIFMGSGDGTVPLFSSGGFYAGKIINVSSEHSELPTDTRNSVYKEISGKDPETQPELVKKADSLLFVSSGETNKIGLVDSKGRKVGFNSNTKKIEKDIPLSFYGGLMDIHSSLIVVSDPLGEYLISSSGDEIIINVAYVSKDGSVEKIYKVGPKGIKIKISEKSIE